MFPILRCPSGHGGGSTPLRTSVTCSLSTRPADPAGKGALLRREGHYSGQERLNTLDIAKGEMDLNDILDLDAMEGGTNRGRQATKAVGL